MTKSKVVKDGGEDRRRSSPVSDEEPDERRMSRGVSSIGGFTDYSYLGLFVRWTFDITDYSYYGLFVLFVEFFRTLTVAAKEFLKALTYLQAVCRM